MTRFAYHEPRTLAEASRLLLDLGGAASRFCGRHRSLRRDLRGAPPLRARGESEGHSGPHRLVFRPRERPSDRRAHNRTRDRDLSRRRRSLSQSHQRRALARLDSGPQSRNAGRKHLPRFALRRHVAAADRRRGDGDRSPTRGRTQSSHPRVFSRPGKDGARVRRDRDRG